MSLATATLFSAVPEPTLNMRPPLNRTLVILDGLSGSSAVPGAAEVARAISNYSGAAALYAHVVAACDGRLDDSALCERCVDTNRVEAVFFSAGHRATSSALDCADEQGTQMAVWLRNRTTRALDIVGIATDDDVQATAVDAVHRGWATRVLLGLTVGMAPTTADTALQRMRGSGVELVGEPVLRQNRKTNFT